MRQASINLVSGWDHGPLFASPNTRRPLARPHGLQGTIRRRQERLRTPPWADRSKIAALYREARRLTRETGELYVVDHIVPLIGKQAGCVIVSGLHVHWNMRVVHWRANAQKLNWFWPDMPFEQLDLI